LFGAFRTAYTRTGDDREHQRDEQEKNRFHSACACRAILQEADSLSCNCPMEAKWLTALDAASLEEPLRLPIFVMSRTMGHCCTAPETRALWPAITPQWRSQVLLASQQLDTKNARNRRTRSRSTLPEKRMAYAARHREG
jgi:hypothetical protein